MQRIKSFNYYRPMPLIITIVSIYTSIIVCKDVYNYHSLAGFNLAFNILTSVLSAAGSVMVVFWVYQKWLWKLPVFNKLMDFPLIGGSYYGTLISTYKHPETHQPLDGKQTSSQSESLCTY